MTLYWHRPLQVHLMIAHYQDFKPVSTVRLSPHISMLLSYVFYYSGAVKHLIPVTHHLPCQSEGNHAALSPHTPISVSPGVTSDVTFSPVHMFTSHWESMGQHSCTPSWPVAFLLTPEVRGEGGGRPELKRCPGSTPHTQGHQSSSRNQRGPNTAMFTDPHSSAPLHTTQRHQEILSVCETELLSVYSYFMSICFNTSIFSFWSYTFFTKTICNSRHTSIFWNWQAQHPLTSTGTEITEATPS